MEHVLLPPKYREAGVKLIDTGAARHFSSQTFSILPDGWLPKSEQVANKKEAGNLPASNACTF
jgi:hypothetical protein